MPRDLDAVLDGMGWQLDDTERADMHKLQVATLLAWGVHPDSIGPTRKGRGYIAQAMADALQRVETADVSASLPAPQQATPEPVAEDWRADFDLAAQMLTWGRDDGGLDAAQIKEIDAHAAKMFARLKAHATPEPVGEPAAWRWFNSNGDQVSNWLDFKAAQKANVEAQVAEAGGRIEYAYTRPAPGVPNPIGHIALTPAEIQSGMDRVRWAENLIRQLPEDHDGRNSWLLNYALGPVPPSAPSDPLEQLEFFQRVEALADRATQRPPFADRWTFDVRSLREFARALRSSERRAAGTVMLHISKADGDKLAEALRLTKPGALVRESTPPIAPQFDEAVKVLQSWGYSFTGDKWAPPEGAPFYVKRANVSRVRRGSPPATDVVLVASLDTVSIPGDWVAVYPGPAEAVRQATAEEVFLAEVLDEVLRARAKFPGDRVMGLALAEKFGELIKAVLDESPDRVRREAVQTAAMCVRLVLDGDGSVKEWRAARGLAPLVQSKEGNQP